MIDPEDIRRIILEVKEKEGHDVARRSADSPLPGGAAFVALCKYLADRLSAKAEAETEALRRENAEMAFLFSDRVKDCELARVAVYRERAACAQIVLDGGDGVDRLETVIASGANAAIAEAILARGGDDGIDRIALAAEMMEGRISKEERRARRGT